MVRGIVDDVGVFGADKILELVMSIYHTVRASLTDSSDQKCFLLLGNFERVEVPTGRMDQRLRFSRSMACG